MKTFVIRIIAESDELERERENTNFVTDAEYNCKANSFHIDSKGYKSTKE